MRIDLTGRVAFVTGAAQGIGKAIALELRAAGATVVIADMDGDGLGAFAVSQGFTARVMDVSERSAAHRAIADVVAAHGRIDILVNAAGGVRGRSAAPSPR